RTADLRAALLQRGAEDDVVDLATFVAGPLDGLGHAVTGRLLGLGVVDRAPVSLADRSTGGRDDHGLSHGNPSCRKFGPSCTRSVARAVILINMKSTSTSVRPH